MKISAHGLSLELQPCRQLDDEDWCRVQVLASVPGFEADFETWLQGSDLVRFAMELDGLYESAGKPGSASLFSAEPNIFMELTMQTLGGIKGQYKFRNDAGGEVPAILSGGFDLDQSYLPSLRNSVSNLLAELGGAREA